MTAKEYPKRLKVLYQQMADLTKPKCGECRIPYYCCSPEHCEETARYAEEKFGVTLPRGEGRLPFLGETGCTVEPYMRPICSVHVCDNHQWNVDFAQPYFDLRDEITQVEFDEGLLDT